MHESPMLTKSFVAATPWQHIQHEAEAEGEAKHEGGGEEVEHEVHRALLELKATMRMEGSVANR
jgi:F0F1-type ATP synthase membrane subunit b/b'